MNNKYRSLFYVSRTVFCGVGVLCALLCFLAFAVAAPPEAPRFFEPEEDTDSVHPEDLHVVLTSFVDPDGDAHQGTQVEVVKASNEQLVWSADVPGDLNHLHFGDGTFHNDLTGQDVLEGLVAYRIRARYRDSTGAWGAWSSWVPFSTQPAYEPTPALVASLGRTAAPLWTRDNFEPLPEAGLSLQVSTALGSELVRFDWSSEVDSWVSTHGQGRAIPDAVRIVVTNSKSSAVEFPASRVQFMSEQEKVVDAFLPSMTLGGEATAWFWVADNGETYLASASDGEPKLDVLTRDLPFVWQFREPGFVIEPFVEGLWMPVNLAMHPQAESAQENEPYMYVNELYGNIKAITKRGEVHLFAENLLNFSPATQFPGSGEIGVSGLCVRPATNDLYVTMVTSVNDVLVNKIVRLSSRNGLVADAVEDVLVMEQDRSHASHQIHSCVFTDDDKLIVAIGNGKDSDLAGVDPGSFRGKIIRLHPDGSADSNNPDYDPNNPTSPQSYQFARGLRNPFGLTMAPDGEVWMAENGPKKDRLAIVQEDMDFVYDGSNESMENFALFTWGPPATAPTALTFLDSPAFPDRLQGRLFVNLSGPTYGRGQQRSGKILEYFDIPESIVPGETRLDWQTHLHIFMRYVGLGRATLVGIASAPDGLYVTDLYRDEGHNPVEQGGRIWRIRYAPQSRPTLPPGRGDVGPGPGDFSSGDTSPRAADEGCGCSVPSRSPYSDWFWLLAGGFGVCGLLYRSVRRG